MHLQRISVAGQELHFGWASRQFIDQRAVLGRRNGRDHRSGFRHDWRGLIDGFGHVHVQDLAARSAALRHEIDILFVTEGDLLDFVGGTGKQPPGAAGRQQPVLMIAAIAEGHAGPYVPAIARRGECNFRNAGKVLADFVSIVLGLVAQPVKVDLLVEMHIGRGPLAIARIARVVKAGVVRIPHQATARRGVVHARDRFRERLAGGGFIHMHVPAFAATGGQRCRQVAAIDRGDRKVNFSEMLGVDRVGIEDRALRGEIVERAKGDHDLVLMLLIALHREDFAAALLDGEIARLGRLEDLAKLAREDVAIRKRFEKGARSGVLCVGPLFHGRVIEVFQPTVIVGHLDFAVSVGDRLLGSLRQQRAGRAQNDRNAQHAVKCTKVGQALGLRWPLRPPA